MNAPVLRSRDAAVVWPAHIAACARGDSNKLCVPLDPKTTHSIVHIDKEFVLWMKEEYPQLLLVYVPANCTGVMQLGHVIYNRPLTHRFTLEHMQFLTDCVLEQVEEGKDAADIKFDKAVSKGAKRAMQWSLAVFESMRGVDLEGTLQSIAYAECFADHRYQWSCWKKWQQGGEADVEAVPDEADTVAQGDHAEELKYGNDADQRAYYMEYYNN